MIRAFVAGVGVLLLAGCEVPQPDPADDAAAIEAALRQWPEDFNAERLDGVCDLFAEDVVLVYPDSADRNRDEFCGQMRGLFTKRCCLTRRSVRLGAEATQRYGYRPITPSTRPETGTGASRTA